MNPSGSFNEFYSEHANAVFRVCIRAVSRREVAEELTSEVFLALHQNWNKLTPDQLPAWLFTVAKRRCADYWRHHYVEEGWVSSYIDETTWSEPEHPLADLLASCVRLKPIHRICITLRFAEGMSRTEIAKHLGLSELQVKGHLQYSLQLLREHIQPGADRDRKGGTEHVELKA